jgi:predicted RNase H-like HicB family nuclease
MSEIIFLVEPDPEGGYTAKALGYSIFTEADTWDEIETAIQDAITCHFEEDERPPGKPAAICASRHNKMVNTT